MLRVTDEQTGTESQVTGCLEAASRQLASRDPAKDKGVELVCRGVSGYSAEVSDSGFEPRTKATKPQHSQAHPLAWAREALPSSPSLLPLPPLLSCSLSVLSQLNLVSGSCLSQAGPRV